MNENGGRMEGFRASKYSPLYSQSFREQNRSSISPSKNVVISSFSKYTSTSPCDDFVFLLEVKILNSSQKHCMKSYCPLEFPIS